jgi:hypothetical protein
MYVNGLSQVESDKLLTTVDWLAAGVLNAERGIERCFKQTI